MTDGQGVLDLGEIPPPVDGAAVISDDGTYRYLLTRRWGNGEQGVLWVMLNPSTADAEANDNTICRCINYSRQWGYDHLAVVNLYALRSADPSVLATHPAPVGPDNDRHITAMFADRRYELRIAAWGAYPCRDNRDMEAVGLAGRAGLSCLSTTKGGAPGHPLYLRAGLKPKRFQLADQRSQRQEGNLED